jgi:transposase-like protein
MNSSDFLTDVQLAARWQVHRQTLLRWRRQATGPAYARIEGRVLYPLAEVERYEQANTITHDSQ